jgi:hypothetical protein
MSMCNVLGVLGDSEDEMWETLDAAVALADAENARLTLVKTCDDGRTYVWVTPFAFGGAYVPPPVDSPTEAARILARAVEFVPARIPVTTLVLDTDTQRSLLKLLRDGHYGAVVAEEYLLAHCRRLRRELRREQIREVPIKLGTSEQFGGDTMPSEFSSNGLTEDDLLDVGQITQDSGRSRSGGLRLWHARRLAGAGGKQ